MPAKIKFAIRPRRAFDDGWIWLSFFKEFTSPHSGRVLNFRMLNQKRYDAGERVENDPVLRGAFHNATPYPEGTVIHGSAMSDDEYGRKYRPGDYIGGYWKS